MIWVDIAIAVLLLGIYEKLRAILRTLIDIQLRLRETCTNVLNDKINSDPHP